jgi:hypothetical protein
MITEVRRYTIEFANQREGVIAGVILTKFIIVLCIRAVLNRVPDDGQTSHIDKANRRQEGVRSR